jgi:peptide/nickel transport system substrate-binding protein
MTHTIRRLVSAAALLAALAMPAATTAANAQVLQLGVDGNPVGLDPHLVTAFNSFQIVNGTIYEGLTAIDKDLRTVPGLAEKWEVSADAKTYTFTLRANAKFHDGSAMTAEDAAASLKRVMGKEIASPLASRLAAVDAVETPSATTLIVKLKEPSAPLLTSLALIAVVPKAFETNKDALQKTPVGTGPFKFKDWQPNGFIELEKHTAYWNAGKPAAAGVKFNIVPESATRQVGLNSGQYSMLPNIDAATALQLKGKPGITISETLELAYTLVGMNTSKAPFDNPKVREALNYALNRGEIVQAALFGAGVPGGPLSPALKDWAVDTKQFACYAHSKDKALALLREAGVSPAITLLVLPRQDIKDIAQVVQQQLNNAGFKVELKIPEIGQFVKDWRESNFDAFVSTNAGSPEPDDYFFRTFKTGGSTNVFKYSNPELDKLLDEGRSTVALAGRKAAYNKVQTILACSGPIAHLAYGQLFTATRSTVSGFDIIANRSLSSLAGVSQK